MMTKEQERRKAVDTFYCQEAVVLIDFRTALDVIERVTDSDYVPAEFFCNRDAERLFAAYNAIVVRFLAKSQGTEMASPSIAPTEENGFPPAH